MDIIKTHTNLRLFSYFSLVSLMLCFSLPFSSFGFCEEPSSDDSAFGCPQQAGRILFSINSVKVIAPSMRSETFQLKDVTTDYGEIEISSIHKRCGIPSLAVMLDNDHKISVMEDDESRCHVCVGNERAEVISVSCRETEISDDLSNRLKGLECWDNALFSPMDEGGGVYTLCLKLSKGAHAGTWHLTSFLEKL